MAFILAGSATDWVDLLNQLITFSTANGWTVQRRTEEAVSATVAAGGTGYTVGDTLTVAQGFEIGAAITFNVDTAPGGVVGTVSLITAGSVNEAATNPVTTTGGTGTGCTLNVTYTPLTSVVQSTNSNQVILKGTGSGTDEIFVGIFASNPTATAFPWSLLGFTGFQSNTNILSQPDVSANTAHVPLNNSPITFWFFVSPRRIMGVFRIGSTYTNMYLGFLNRFATELQYPYPLLALGCSRSSTLIFSDSSAGMSGMVDPVSNSSASDTGPGQIRDPGGTWKGVANSGGTIGGFRLVFRNRVIWPAGEPVVGVSLRKFTEYIPPESQTPVRTMDQTPDSTAVSGFRFPLIPATLMEGSPVEQILGELDNVFWAGTLTETAGQAVSEDVYVDNGNEYLLFQNVNRTDHWSHFLIKKE